jgi:hypothetical protein
MIEILIVCGIKNEDKYHEKIIGIINKINKHTIITKALCNFTTLQRINYDTADIYMSDFADKYFIYDKSLEEYVIEDLQDEKFGPIKKFNIENNNKFDYIILEQCPLFNSINMIPEFIKHYNLLKKNGYLILYINSNLTSEFDFSHHKEFPILDNLYSRYNNNIYKKENDDIYNMEQHCENYYNYCLNYNPKLNYKDLATVKNEDLALYKNKELAKKYFKYKKKYLNLKLY